MHRRLLLSLALLSPPAWGQAAVPPSAASSSPAPASVAGSPAPPASVPAAAAPATQSPASAPPSTVLPPAAPAAAPPVAASPVLAPQPLAPVAPVAPVASVAPVAPVAQPPRSSGAPPARRGFQMHFVPLTAVMFPFGDATGGRGDSLSGRYGWQWMPFDLGIGAKITDEIYLGGYLNIGVGSEGGDLATAARCDAGDGVEDDVSCSAVSVRAGIEARYTFTPSDSASGWLGYGVGLTNGSQSISDAGRYSESTTSQGFELGRITGGLDFRVKRGFGLGPFGMLSIGRYTHTRTEVRDLVTYSGDIDDPDLHLWIGAGLRMVVFP